jgi:hypothetical protein
LFGWFAFHIYHHYYPIDSNQNFIVADKLATIFFSPQKGDCRMPAKSAKIKSAIFRQVCEIIPLHMVAKLARKHKIKLRAITPHRDSGKNRSYIQHISYLILLI